jgi:phosphatidylglycerol lysyltransferase
VFCRNNDLKSVYYRVDESFVQLFRNLKKKALLIGQEAIVNVGEFTMEGGQRKSLRNAINTLKKKNFAIKIYQPPIKAGLLQKLKAVSDEWLIDTDYEEIVFSQGIFATDQLQNQTIITIESPEEKVIAFLNIIPDFTKDEGTYDLIRKTKDAPNGSLDFLIIEMFDYFKSIGIHHVNLGLAPMSGITDAKSIAEYTIKFAYENIKQFGHYKGLRSFKEKFAPEWVNKYLIFDNSYDLLQIPSALNKVVKYQ